MSRLASFKKALSAGLEPHGFQRSGEAWITQAGELKWAVKVRSRPWAGAAVDAELKSTAGAEGADKLLALVAVETLPIANSLAMRQALDYRSHLPEEERLSRIVSLGASLGELLHGSLSPARLIRELDGGILSYNWTSAGLRIALSELSTPEKD